jgi:DNA-directed RNA polymerase specialized sigma24 family protein
MRGVGRAQVGCFPGPAPPRASENSSKVLRGEAATAAAFPGSYPFRVVFVLRSIEEISVEETAEQLGIPEATVKTAFTARG